MSIVAVVSCFFYISDKLCLMDTWHELCDDDNARCSISLLLLFYLGDSHANDGICRLNGVMNVYKILTYLKKSCIVLFLSLHVHF